MTEKSLKCAQVRKLLEDYFEGTLPPRRRQLAAAHLERCETCAAELRRLESMCSALAVLPQAEPDPSLLPQMSARISALRQPRAFSHRRVWLAPALASGTALVCAVIFLAFWSARQPSPPVLPQPTQAVKPLPRQPAPTTLARVPPAGPSRAPALVATPSSRRPRRSSAPRAIAPRSAPAPLVTARTVTSERQAQEVVQTEAQDVPEGVILVLGPSREPVLWSRYRVELSMPDGAKSVLRQVIGRDETGAPSVVRVAYRATPPETRATPQGG
jgi:hypothetical protein